MIANVTNPWFWVPLASAAGVSLISIIAAYLYNRRRGKWHIRKNFFEGPAREAASLTGVFLPLLPIILSADVRNDKNSLSLLVATSLLALFSVLIGHWLYSAVQALPQPDNNSVEIETPFWIAVQGVVFSCQLSAILTLIAFIFVSPLFA